MQIKDIMTKNVQYINVNKPIEEAAQMMDKGNFGALPVEKDNRLAGMITDRDLAMRVVGQGRSPEDLKVADCMSEGIEYCYEDERLADASSRMSETRYRRLPVLSRDKKLVGIVSLGDLALNEESRTATHEALKQICH